MSELTIAEATAVLIAVIVAAAIGTELWDRWQIRWKGRSQDF